jgi:hypothetical protein
MEGEGVVQDVEAGSSTGTESAESTSQATTQPAQTGQTQQTVPYDRFQQVIRQVQEYRPLVAQVPQLQQQLKEAQDRLATFEKKASQGTATPEEAMQMQLAVQALERLMLSDQSMLERVLMSHPKFKALAENADKLLASTGGVEQIQQAQSQALYRQAQSHIRELASSAGLPADPKYLSRLVKAVAAEAQSLPDGNARFAAGDLSVLDEAFKSLQTDFLSHTQRAGTAQLLATKQRTQSLPPAPRGSAAGPPGLPKYDPSQPNALGKYMSKLDGIAGQMLAEGGSKE